jgi:N-acetylmuramoyl-L-alanine amidase
LSVRGLAAALVAALWLLPVVLPAEQTAAPALPYTVLSRDARRPLAVRSIGGQEMFALDDLARLFTLAVREDTLAGGLTVTVNNQTIVLSPQQPLASVAGRMISLPTAPVRDGRTWYVPVDFVSRALAPIYGSRLELRKPSRLIVLGDLRMPRVAGRIEPLGSVTRVTLDVAPPTPHTVSQEGSRLLIRFDADILDAALPTPGASDVLQGLHPGDSPQVVAFDLGPRFASYRVSDQPGTAGAARIVVELVAQTETPAQAPPTPQPAQPGQPTAPPLPETPPLLDLPPPGGLRAIVIDPGHGGDEAGAKGKQGVLEKNVTLAVARRLKTALEARLGVRVLLTRDADQTVPLDQRAALANNNKADLFLSLHANASVRPAVSGAEVFFLSLAEYGDEAEKAAHAQSETLPVLGGGNRDIEVVLWEMAQARHIEQSAAFARAIEASLRDRVPMSPRSLQQAPFRVLVGANMPAVLVEMGFLTNPQQEQRLASDDYQNTIVQALVDGILRYRAGAGAFGALRAPQGRPDQDRGAPLRDPEGR